MVESPVFRKHDRYKASSYCSYNFKMPLRYDMCFWQKFCQTPLWDRTLVEELHPNIGSLRILDIGCATGRLLERLAEAGASHLFGVDLAPRILEVAEKKLSRAGASVDLRAGDAEDRLPWHRDSFDAVTLTGGLHHFFRPRDALAEVHRVLRPGGRILIIDPCFVPPMRRVLNAALRVAPHDGDFHFYSTKEAVDLLVDLGFEVGRTRRVGLWSFFAYGLKPRIARRESGSAVTRVDQ